MKIRFISLMILVQAPFGLLVHAANTSPAAQIIDKDCQQDAIAAKCGKEQVGSGLMGCLTKFRAANPSYALSHSCVFAIAGVLIDQRCKADATTANCGAEQVGSGLLNCFNQYKKTNATFKLSPGCAGVVNGMGADEACQPDAGKAGCGLMMEGSGLAVCLDKYQKANPSFQYSPQCQAAMHPAKKK